MAKEMRMLAQENSRQISIRRAKSSVETGEAVYFGFLFSLFTRDSLERLLSSSPGQYLFFPAVLVMGLVKLILQGAYIAQADGKKKGLIATFVLDSLLYIAMGVAIIGSLVAASIFAALITPIIFTALMGIQTFRSFVNLVNTLLDPSKGKWEAGIAGFFTLMSAAMTVGVALIFIAAVPFTPVIAGILTGLNVLAAVIGISLLIREVTSSPPAASMSKAKEFDEESVDVKFEEGFAPAVKAEEKTENAVADTKSSSLLTQGATVFGGSALRAERESGEEHAEGNAEAVTSAEIGF